MLWGVKGLYMAHIEYSIIGIAVMIKTLPSVHMLKFGAFNSIPTQDILYFTVMSIVFIIRNVHLTMSSYVVHC